MRSLAILLTMVFALLATACGGGTDSGIRTASADEAADVLADPPEGLVVLDVRTPEEFDAGHLAGATMIDFYETGFSAQIADLDRDAPYLMYCRTGNRSGQTRALMESLGFTNVIDVEGGIVAWTAAGHPTTVTVG